MYGERPSPCTNSPSAIYEETQFKWKITGRRGEEKEWSFGVCVSFAWRGLDSFYRGYVLLIVNVASRCGLAAKNYAQMVGLDEKYRKLELEASIVIATPNRLQQQG